MPGMIGVFRKNHQDSTKTSLIDSINLNSIDNVKTLDFGVGFFAVSSLNNSVLPGSEYFENSNYLACLSGDLIGAEGVPWDQIIENFKNNDFSPFSDFRGTFCFAILDKKNQCLALVSDRTSLQPIYYLAAREQFIFSTAMSTFCRLARPTEFNPQWLYELIFFNYPIGSTTFLKGVKRMPPASVLIYNHLDTRFSLSKYSEHFRINGTLLEGEAAIDRAFAVFSDRIPEYFSDNVPVACSLSGGLDSRMVLSFALSNTSNSLTTYTYGIPGCYDLQEASDVARSLQLSHRKILFDSQFLEQLPKLITETAYLSNGLQSVNRSTLLYVYRALTNNGGDFPIIISGVSGDDLFRHHISSHHFTISPDILQVFRTGKRIINREFYQEIFPDHINDFMDSIHSALDTIENDYGKLSSFGTYLFYVAYEVTPKYFGGEAAIANNFAKFRTPFWDSDIIQMSYEIEFSLLGFSKASKKDKYREKFLQTKLMQKNKKISKVTIEGIPLNLYTINSKPLFYLYRFLRNGPKKLSSKIRNVPHYQRLEDWQSWYRTILNHELDRCITKESILSNYISLEFMKTARNNQNSRFLGKFLSSEIILNLMKNKWRM